jgi:hypothetical protein
MLSNPFRMTLAGSEEDADWFHMQASSCRTQATSKPLSMDGRRFFFLIFLQFPACHPEQTAAFRSHSPAED